MARSAVKSDVMNNIACALEAAKGARPDKAPPHCPQKSLQGGHAFCCAFADAIFSCGAPALAEDVVIAEEAPAFADAILSCSAPAWAEDVVVAADAPAFADDLLLLAPLPTTSAIWLGVKG